MRIMYRKVSEAEAVKTVDNSDQDDNSQLDWVPAGGSSCAKWNRNYKMLINNLEMHVFTQEELFNSVEKWLADELMKSNSIEINLSMRQPAINLLEEKELEIAGLINYMGWSASSIWSKFKISASQLNQILSKVKKEGVKRKRNIKAAFKYKQSQYERREINYVKEAVDSQLGEWITVATIRRKLMKEYPEENLSSSKIRRLLKSELKMVFKNLDKVEAKMCSIENISKFYESAGIQILFEKDEWELIYVDEFTVDTRKHVHRGWARRGEKGLLKTDQGGIALNIVVAFSRLRMYGIMINKNTNDSLSFIYFLQQLAMIRRAFHQLLNNKWWVIADNA